MKLRKSLPRLLFLYPSFLSLVNSLCGMELASEPPALHIVNDQQPVTFAYRATRYVGKNLKYGPFGDPVVCTVSA